MATERVVGRTRTRSGAIALTRQQVTELARAGEQERNKEEEEGVDNLISSLMDSDNIVPAVRAALESGGQDGTEYFCSRLEAYARNRDADIEEICNFHYQVGGRV